jgi:hypothetical protein
MTSENFIMNLLSREHLEKLLLSTLYEQAHALYVTFVLAQIMFLSKMHVCRAFFITDRMLRI